MYDLLSAITYINMFMNKKLWILHTKIENVPFSALGCFPAKQRTMKEIKE